MIKIPRNAEVHDPSEQSPIPLSPQLSPQLLLPAPPQDRWQIWLNTFQAYARQPSVVASFRATLFLAKLLSITLPCSPFAPNPWFLYPLLGLAALDLASATADLRWSTLLAGLHVATTLAAARENRLCERPIARWEEY